MIPGTCKNPGQRRGRPHRVGASDKAMAARIEIRTSLKEAAGILHCFRNIDLFSGERKSTNTP
jgi:hypothetical protein